MTAERLTMFKYQYILRETFFRLLKYFPFYFKEKILGVFVSQERKKLFGLKTPAQIILYLTNRCNARCSHCFYWREVASEKKKELNLSQLARIAKSLKDPLNTLSLTGGEPFMREDLPAIVKIFSDNNQTQKVNIATNGFSEQKIYDQTLKILRATDVDLNIQVSLDGLEKTHNKIRKVKIFNHAINTLKKLTLLQDKFLNFHLTVQTTITRDNLGEIDRLAIFLKKEIPKVHQGFQFVRSPADDVFMIDKKILSGYNPSSEPLLTISEMEQAFKKFSVYRDPNNLLLDSYVRTMNRNIIRMKKLKQPFVKCLAGTYDAVIWPDGQVSMCEFTRPFASLKNYQFNFFKLWQSKPAEAMRKKIANCFCGHTCNLLNAMRFDEKALVEVVNEKD